VSCVKGARKSENTYSVGLVVAGRPLVKGGETGLFKADQSLSASATAARSFLENRSHRSTSHSTPHFFPPILSNTPAKCEEDGKLRYRQTDTPLMMSDIYRII
jgi:hypothetical protein